MDKFDVTIPEEAARMGNYIRTLVPDNVKVTMLFTVDDDNEKTTVGGMMAGHPPDQLLDLMLNTLKALEVAMEHDKPRKLDLSDH